MEILRSSIDEVEHASTRLKEAFLEGDEMAICAVLIEIQRGKIDDNTVKTVDELCTSVDVQIQTWAMCCRARIAAIHRDSNLVEKMGHLAMQSGGVIKDHFAVAWSARLLAVLRYGQARYSESLEF